MDQMRWYYSYLRIVFRPTPFGLSLLANDMEMFYGNIPMTIIVPRDFIWRNLVLFSHKEDLLNNG
jgi:hypothetical protein